MPTVSEWNENCIFKNTCCKIADNVSRNAGGANIAELRIKIAVAYNHIATDVDIQVQSI